MAKHPLRDEILVGGADGIPKIYRVFRETERKIGDDANLIAALDADARADLRRRHQRDGRGIAAASSLDRRGQVDVYADDFDLRRQPRRDPRHRRQARQGPLGRGARRARQVPPGVDPPGRRRPGPRRERLRRRRPAPTARAVAAAGTEGIVRLLDATTGALAREFCPVPVDASPDRARRPDRRSAPTPTPPTPPRPSPPCRRDRGARGAAASHRPRQPRRPACSSSSPPSRPAGERVDVTRSVAVKAGRGVVRVSRPALSNRSATGEARSGSRWRARRSRCRSGWRGWPARARGDYVRDVTPILSKLGCNMGTCHGSAQGKNGFKLSLRGLRPDLRHPRPDRRPRVEAGQPRLARR